MVAATNGRTDTPSPEQWFHERATHYVAVHVLHHLNRVGVFSLLAEHGPHTVAGIAGKLGLREPVLASLLDYVWAVEDLLARDDGGRYAISDFGHGVLDRYDRRDADGRRVFNFWDVRAGGYDPVWGQLDGLLTGDKVYGRDVHRDGDYAASGVYKVAARLAPLVEQVVGELGVTRLVEIGVPTGLAAKLGQAHPSLELFGLDRSRDALDDARRRAREIGASNVQFLHGDFFEPDGWVEAVRGDAPGIIGSIHFHEFVRDGGARVQGLLADLRERLPGWCVLALEQPALAPEERHAASPTVWGYSNAMKLIHHLIENGICFSHAEWQRLFRDAGCRERIVRRADYLDYGIYVYEL